VRETPASAPDRGSPAWASASGVAARKTRLAPGVALTAALAMQVLSAVTFAPHQSLWVDETTQLAGISLGPGRVLPWLAGRGPDLGVPADRTPPASYFVGMAWSGLAGPGEASLRRLGILCSVIGVGFTALAVRRAYGAWPAAAAAWFLACSPNVLVYSVEIRAYPVLLMLSGMATYALVRSAEAEGRSRTWWIGITTAVIVAAAMTHFFGVVLGGAVIVALLVDAWRAGKHIAPVGAAGATFAAACSALSPFVLAALRMSSSEEPARTDLARRVAKLVYRLYGHPALTGSRTALALATAGFASAVLAGALARRRADTVRVPVTLAVAAGLIAALAASVALPGFDAATPQYNVWAIPFVAVLLARGLAADRTAVRWVAAGALAALLGGTAAGVVEIIRQPDAYAHGPQRRLFDVLSRLGPERTVLVYEADSDAAGLVFYPIRYSLGRAFPQYRVEAGGTTLALFDPDDATRARPLETARTAVVIRARSTPAKDLARLLRANEQRPPLAGADLLRRQGWRTESRDRFVSLVSADIEVLRRDR
jgi:hypothetical protein